MSRFLRVQVEPSYAALVGTAVYVFAYYEWAVIHLIAQFSPGFVAHYSREEVMTSGAVKRKLKGVIDDPATVYTAVSKPELQACRDRFDGLIDKRNSLIHAHPITDPGGTQILSYQSRVRRDGTLPDMKWPVDAVSKLLDEFDAAACEATELLHRLL